MRRLLVLLTVFSLVLNQVETAFAAPLATAGLVESARAPEGMTGAQLFQADQSGGGLEAATALSRECSAARRRDTEMSCDINSTQTIMLSFQSFMESFNGPCLPQTPSGQDEGPFYRADYTNDFCVCSCLASSQAQDGETFRNSMTNEANRALIQRRTNSLNRNIERLNNVIIAERNGMRVQGSSLPTTNETGSFLASYFTNRETFDINVSLSTTQDEVTKAYNKATRGDATTVRQPGMTPIRIPPPEPRLLTSNAPRSPNCVSLRTFQTAGQFPRGDDFYAQMASETSFVDSEWNYQTLRERLRSLARDSREPLVNRLTDVIEKPELNRIYEKIQFLERNPLYKSLFSSPDAAATPFKRELWGKIKAAYGTPGTPKQRADAFNNLRSDTGLFFTRNGVALEPILQSGASANMRVILNEIPRRVGDITGYFSAENTWALAVGDVSSQRNREPADNRGRVPTNTIADRRDPAIYATYCPNLGYEAQLNQFGLLQDMENNFSGFWSPEEGNNDEYFMLNNALCDTPRRKADGTTMDYQTYLRNNCQVPNPPAEFCLPENQERLLGRFIQEYPQFAPGDGNSREYNKDDLLYLLPFLNREATIPTFTAQTAAQTTSEGTNSRFTSNPELRQRLQQATADFNENSRNGSVINPNYREEMSSMMRQSSTRTTDQQTQNQQRQNTPQAQNQATPFAALPMVYPDAQAAAAAVPAATAETPQAQLARSDADLTGIRSQLADLNRDLAEENSKPQASRNSDQLAQLNARLEQLNSRLEDTQRQNLALRNQIADAESNRTQNRPPETRSAPDEVRRGPASVSSVTPSSPTPQTQSDSQPVAPQMTAPTSFSGGGFSGGAGIVRPTTVLSSGNSALLSKYGVQSGTVQGSIIVADASSTVDYQSLRTQSGETAVPISLSPEEFNRVARNDQTVMDRYLEQFRNMPGNVIRVNISATGIDGQPLEYFVLKNGNQISLVPANGSTPSRTPASTPASARVFTLGDLRREMRN